jgi:hypothetical protein
MSYVSGVPLYICNDHIYGFVMVPLEQSDSLQLDFMQLTNLKLEVLGMSLYSAFYFANYDLYSIVQISVIRYFMSCVLYLCFALG